MSRNRRDMFTRPKSVGEIGPADDPPEIPEGDNGSGVTYGKTQRIGGDVSGQNAPADAPQGTETAAPAESGTDTPQDR